MTQPRSLVSYIFPIFNEQGNIDVLYERMAEVVAERADLDFEFVFINDGSRDDSLRTLTALSERDDRIRIFDFSRNFGHQQAVTCGIDHARGDALIIMDSDLQDPPEVSLELIAKWEEGYDVVYAQRRTRKDTWFKRTTARAFYWLLGHLAEIDIPPNTGDFRLITREVADQLSAMREHNRFLRGMVSYIGFRQVAVQFDRDERHSGDSGYPLAKMISFALDGLLGFSTFPLKLISRVGYFVSALTLLGALYALGVKLLRPEVAIPGWTFTVMSVLLIGGLQFVFLGVIGSYVGRIYTEVQDRPNYIVQRVITGGRSARPGRKAPDGTV